MKILIDIPKETYESIKRIAEDEHFIAEHRGDIIEYTIQQIIDGKLIQNKEASDADSN